MYCLTADLATNEQQAEAQTFYEDLGTLAKEKKLVTTLLLSPSCMWFRVFVNPLKVARLRIFQIPTKRVYAVTLLLCKKQGKGVMNSPLYTIISRVNDADAGA